MMAELKERSGSVAAVAVGGNGGDVRAGQGALYSEHFTTILRRGRDSRPAGGIDAAKGEGTIRHE
jgi:hypothetical protein